MDTTIILRHVERLIVTTCAPLIYIGYRLFRLGYLKPMNASGKSTGQVSVRISNLTPGALCFILGVALGAYVMLARVDVGQGARDGTPATAAEEGGGRHWSGMPGVGTAIDRPTVLVRRVLSDFALSVLASPTQPPSASALQELNSKLRSIPQATKLSEIEAKERMGTRAAQEEVWNWYRALLPVPEEK
jgi:hypothetical protein